MRTIKRVLSISVIICMLFTSGNIIAFAEQDKVVSGVKLYKNDELVGTYSSVNTAFDLMDDVSADYRVELLSDQTLTGYKSWPVVNSIEISPYDLQEGVDEGVITNFIVEEEDITLNSDIVLSDWICFRPEIISGKVSYADINIQGYELIIDQKVQGHTVSIGYEGKDGNTGINIIGAQGSKIVLNETANFFNSSVQVDEVIMNAEKSSTDSLWIGYELLLHNSAKTNVINVVTAYYGNGMVFDNADISISKFNEVENPMDATSDVAQYLWLQGDSDVIIEDMYETCTLKVDFLDIETVKNSSISLTGTIQPSEVMITMAVNHEIQDADETRAFFFENTGEYLLYAPNLDSEKVSISCGIYNNLNGLVKGVYNYSGKLESTNGYYKTEGIPAINFSNTCFVSNSMITEQLTYVNAGEEGKLKSVSWNIYEIGTSGYVEHPEWSKTFGWDKEKLGFGIDGLSTDSTYYLNGYFTYEEGTVSVVIPIVVSTMVTAASFDSQEKTFVNPSYTEGQWISLNYESSGTPNVIWTTSNPNVISIVGSGVSATQKINGCGTAVVKAHIGNIVLSCEITVVKQNGWYQDKDGNWYYYKNGKLQKNWQYIGKKYYYFDLDGVMQTEWQCIENKWYYLGPDGAMRKYWQEFGGKWYYLGADGAKRVRWQYLGKKYYYFGTDGIMQTGWKKISNIWYYFNSDGEMQTGWLTIGKQKFYLKSDGAMVTGLQTINSKKYYFDANGVMKTGWQKISKEWFYFDTDGIMQTGWLKIGKQWYYLDINGVMQIGWEKVGSKWYYFDANGVMQTGWLKLGTKWYYLNPSGDMVTGWKTIGGVRYYFDQNGVWIPK